MKPNPFTLLTVALAVNRATSFLTNRPTPSIVRARVDSVFTHFAASDDQIGTSADSTFPHGDLAYDEWRMKFAKGAFDPVRFESFRINFKTLITYNLEARNKASAEGGNPPTWLSLNEYADYYLAEYEAMKRGEPIPTPAVQPTPQHNLVPVEQIQTHQSQPPPAAQPIEQEVVNMADYEAMKWGEPIPIPAVQPTPQHNLALVEQNQSQPPAAQPNEQVVGNDMQTIPTPAVQPTPQHNLALVEQNQTHQSQPPAAQPNEQVVGNAPVEQNQTHQSQPPAAKPNERVVGNNRRTNSYSDKPAVRTGGLSLFQRARRKY
jgi:hypothetical protein